MYNGIDLLLEAAEQLENEEKLEKINKKWASLLPKPDPYYGMLSDSEFLAMKIKEYIEIPILPHDSIKKWPVGKAPEIILFISPGIKYYLGLYRPYHYMLIKEENGHKSLIYPELLNTGRMLRNLQYGYVQIEKFGNRYFYNVTPGKEEILLYDNNDDTASLGTINKRGIFFPIRFYGFY